ncbi:MAG: hypothetical protein EOO85_17825, partial [Pedobacter sp.]
VGIKTRYVVAEDESGLDLAERACNKLFENFDKNKIDYILYCTQSPEYFLPTTACILQDRLGMRKDIGALDFNLGCSGFTYGVNLANALISSGQVGNVLLVTAETYSKFIHPKDKTNRSIFGDAAAATLISKTEDDNIFKFNFGTDIDIKLGRIEVDLTWFIQIIRSVISTANVFQTQMNNTVNKLGNYVGTNLELVAADLRKDNLKTREDSIRKIANELSNKPKQIKILSPTHLATYETDVPIKIHFGGVPTSYLGFHTDELQRVHIFLNGKSISPKSLLLTTNVSTPSTTINGNIGSVLTSITTTAIPLANNASLITDTSLAFHPTTNAGSNLLNTNIRNISLTRVTNNNNSDKKLLENLVKISELNSLSAKGSQVITHVVSPIAPGLVMDNQTMTAVVNESLPGFLLQFTALSKDLVVGVNVLTAIVIDKAGTRHQQNLSFMLVPVTTPATNPNLKNNIILKQVSKIQLADRIQAAKVYAAQQKSLTFKNV